MTIILANRRRRNECTFPASKLPLRGLFRMYTLKSTKCTSCMVIGTALVSNVRRIQRYLSGPQKSDKKKGKRKIK